MLRNVVDMVFLGSGKEVLLKHSLSTQVDYTLILFLK